MGKRTLRRLTALLAAILCALACVLALPGAALAAAVEVDTNEALDAALGVGGEIKLTANLTLGRDIPASATVYMNGCTLTYGGDSLTVSGALSGSGTLSAADVKNGGSIASTVLVTGVLREQNPLTLVSGTAAAVTYTDGTTETAIQGGSGYWIAVKYAGSAIGVRAVTTTAGDAYRLGTKTGQLSQVYRISYINEDQTVAYTANPATYTVGDSPFTLSDPEAKSMLGYTFKGWGTANGYQKNLTVDPAALSGDVAFYAAWEQTPSAGTGAGKTGSVAGGGSGTFAAAASGTAAAASDSDDDDDDTAAAAGTETTNGFGNMRVRMASSTTRHTVHDQTETDVQALANRRASQSRFPWQWLGAGLGAAALLTALGITLKRRADERTAAMLEKLNIKE